MRVTITGWCLLALFVQNVVQRAREGHDVYLLADNAFFWVQHCQMDGF